MRRNGSRFGRRSAARAASSGSTTLTFGFGSGFNTTDTMGTAVGAGSRGSATLGHWCFFPFFMTAVPSGGTGYFAGDFSGSSGWVMRTSGTQIVYGTNGTVFLSPVRILAAGDVGKVHAALGFWNPTTLLTELYVDKVRIGTGTAAATFSPYSGGRNTFGLRSIGLSPTDPGIRLGGYSAGNAELTAGEISQLFDDYKATGNIPTVAGKTSNLYDLKAAVGGGAGYPSTVTDSIGGANLTMYAGSAANLTYTAYSAPTVAW